MSTEQKVIVAVHPNSEIISEEERQHLIAELHRFLVWVGEPLPDSIELNDETIKVREMIWQCIHKKEFSDEEKTHFAQLIGQLENKEKQYEDTLQQDSNLTRKDAKKLYHEIASIIRAIIDIRECEAGKVILKESNEGTRQKIEDAKRWMSFLKNVGRK